MRLMLPPWSGVSAVRQGGGVSWPSDAEHRVDRLLRRVPRGRVAHAEHRNQTRQPVLRVVDDLAFLHQLDVRALAGNHRQQSAMDQPHVGGRQVGVRERFARVLEEGFEVPARHLQLIGGALVRVVAGAEHRDVAPRNHEQVAAVGQSAARVIVHDLAGDHVHRAREARRRRALRGGGKIRQQLGRPRAGGVDDDRAANREGFAGQLDPRP